MTHQSKNLLNKFYDDNQFKFSILPTTAVNAYCKFI